MNGHVEGTDPRAFRRSEYHEADVVVVGAGVFGCAVAHVLARQGRSVLLLERWLKEPDRIVGELLQPGGVAALRKLGLEKCLEGIDAVPCYGYHVMYHDNDVAIPYPEIDAQGRVLVNQKAAISAGANGHANTNGYTNGSANGSAHKQQGGGDEKQESHRPEGRSFHHGRFITQLRKACAAEPNITIVETEVVSTLKGENGPEVLGVEARTADPATGEKKPDYFFGQLTIIADGYASKFRKQYVAHAPVVRSKFYALELIDCPFPPAGFGHVVIGRGFPVLLYQIGTHETRALIDVPEKIPEASPAAGGVRGYIANVVVPSLPPHVQPSVRAALEDGKIPRSMPNSWLPAAATAAAPGVVLLGDALNMRHPLTGGGMTVAFNDVALLAEVLAPARVPDLGDARAVAAAVAAFHRRRKRYAAIINVLAQALYSLFAARDRQLRTLQMGCFAYFRRGWVDEPVGMLGGLIQEPVVLAYHFFSVAFLAIWLNACQVVGGVSGLWKAPLALVDAVLVLWKACVVFLPVMWQEMR